jgi:lipid-A-disaccharide synthase
VKAHFVGHPLVDEIQRRPVQNEDLRQTLSPEGKPIVALFPGSRKMELQRIFPVMLQMPQRFPQFQFVVVGATTQPESYYRELMGGTQLPLVVGRTYDVLSLSEAALVKSGTSTLETALFRVPQVVCYAANGISVWLAKRLANVKYISLPNLILDRPLLTELIQQDLTADKLEAELWKILPGQSGREAMLEGYADLNRRLGSGGASAEAARVVAGVLKAQKKSPPPAM